MALLMLQSLRRDSVIYVRCRVLRSDDPREAPVGGKSYAQWFRDGYDIREAAWLQRLGFSIWPRSQRASHRGDPLLQPCTVAIRALKRVREREARRPRTRHAITNALDLLLHSASSPSCVLAQTKRH